MTARWMDVPYSFNDSPPIRGETRWAFGRLAPNVAKVSEERLLFEDWNSRKLLDSPVTLSLGLWMYLLKRLNTAN
jgi:hypothetical protein